MYKLYIKGAFRGSFKTTSEAMSKVEKWARPFRHNWKIVDGFNKVWAQG